MSSDEEEFDPPSAILLKAEKEVVVKRITTKKFRADPWPRVLEADLGEGEAALCSMLSRMKIEEKGKRMELITQRRTVTRSIEIQCELGGSGLLHLPRFDASLPVETPTTTGFNVITFVGDVEQQQPQRPSEDQQERAGAADVRLKDQQSGSIAKAQEESRHTVASPDNLTITVQNKRKGQHHQDPQQQQPSSSNPAAPTKKAPKLQRMRPQQQQPQQQPQRQQQQRRRGWKQQMQQPLPQQQPMLTARAQKRDSDNVIPLNQQIRHQQQQRGRQHQQQQRYLPQQRPAQGEKRRRPSRQSQQPSPAPKRRGNERVVQSGNAPPQGEVSQPQLPRNQRKNRARKARQAEAKRRHTSGAATQQVEQEQIQESGTPQVSQPPDSDAHNPVPGRVRPAGPGPASVGPPGVVSTQPSREAPTRVGQGQGELAVNQQPAKFSRRAGPRLHQPARSAAPLMTPNQVTPQVGHQQTPGPTVRMPAQPNIPSFPPPRPFVNTTILTLPTQSPTNTAAQIHSQPAPIYPVAPNPAPPAPAASLQVFGAPASSIFDHQQHQANINQQHSLQLQQMADVYIFERQRARAAVEQYVQSTRGAGLVADQFRCIAQDTSVVAPLPTLPPFPLIPPSRVRQSLDVASMANTLTAYQEALQQRTDLFAALPPAAAQLPPPPRQPNLQASLFDALPSSAVAQPPPPERRTEMDFVRAALFSQLAFPETQPPPPGDAPGPH